MRNKTDETTGDHRNKRQRNFLLRLRPMFRWVSRLCSTPASIAGGLAMGTFVAFTPTMGIQFILVVILATLFKLSRTAAIVPIWITNPVTVAPIYTFNYWIGLQFCDGPPLCQVSALFVDMGKAMAKMEIWQIREQVQMILHIGKEVILPLWIGSSIVGAVCGILVYLISLKLLCILFYHRKKKSLLSKRKT